MPSTTCGQLHSYRNLSALSSSTFLNFYSSTLIMLTQPQTCIFFLCLLVQISKGKIILNQPGLPLVPRGSGSSLVQSGAHPLKRGCKQRDSDYRHTQDSFLLVAIVFCWQFSGSPIIWLLSRATSP